MARKTFISYKYSESQCLRDKIINSLGEDATFYNGETSDSPDLTDLKTDSIKEKLKSKIYDTSVLIVILSPNMNDSKWIPWEIEYALKEITREGKTSHTNGIVAVIQKNNDSYDWFQSYNDNCHGDVTISYKMNLIPDLVSKNHFNSNPPKWHCDKCRTYEYDTGSYISFIEEEVFLSNPNKYIESAYEKSQHLTEYNIVKK